MRSAAVVCFVCLQFLGLHSRAQSAEPREPSTDELVRRALQAELGGENEQRQNILEQALASSPGHAAARWHAGFVRVDDDWLSVEDVERQAVEAGDVARYRQLRDQHWAAAAGQVALARWCRRHKLDEQEKLHWGIVLRLDPRNEEARERLAILERRGERLTRDEIDALRSDRAERERVLRYWRSKFESWREAAGESNPGERESALEAMRLVGDPAAIPAIEETLSLASEESGLLAVDILAAMQGDQALQALLRHAVLSDFPRVRESAARQLRSRSHFAYVPQLLGLLRTPVELNYYVNAAPGYAASGVRLEHEGPVADYSYAEYWQSVDRSPARSTAVRSRAAARRGAAHARRVAAAEQAVRGVNVQTAALNERVISALRTATGQRLDERPQSWWQWWQQENELYAAQQKPLVLQASAHTQYYSSAPTSCFLCGTLVWTDTGPVAIEKVRVGDLVLSQHPESGELAYKLVVGTTLRPPSPTLRITAGGDTLAATLGHPLWVVGQGWRMAKQLETGDSLHGVHGSVQIEDIQAGPEAKAYNLVVADFNTFCVGKHRLLVHDNRARRPVDTVLPGFYLE